MFDDRAEWISYDEASRRLGVSKVTIQRYAAAGRIRARRLPVGNRVEVNAADIEDLKQPRPFRVAEKGENAPPDEGMSDSSSFMLAPA